MKAFLQALLAVLTIVAVPGAATAATDVDCQKAYGTAVSACAQGLSFLAPTLRAGAQKACVQDAQIAKQACMRGVNYCLNTCQTNYSTALATCQSDYDYNYQNCTGNPICIDYYTQQKAQCESAAVNALNTCTAACPVY